MEQILVIGTVLIIMLGLALVVHCLIIFDKQRKGQLASSPQVKFRFLKFEIQSGRTMVIFVVGIALLVFSLMSTAEILKEEPPHSRQRPSIVPEPKDFKEIDQAEEPVYLGFHFKKDIRVIDLRSRLPVSEKNAKTKYSPVTWTRYSLLRKLDNDLNHIDFEFATTGIDLHARCLTHAYVPRKITGPHYHGNRAMNNTWQLRVDVKEAKEDQDFIIINEATYWNAFAGDSSEWAAISVIEETDNIALLILFPESKPFISYKLFAYPHGIKQKKLFRDPAIVIPSENRQVFVWKVEQPRLNYTYEVQWTW